MKLRWIFIVGVALVTAGGLFLLLRPRSSEQKAVEETRQLLRQQGFKTDLVDFDFSTSEEMRARVAALTNADFVRAAERSIGYPRLSALQEGKPELMKGVGPDSAAVVWKQEKLESHSGQDIWPLLQEVMDECRPQLDAACEATLPGPISFNLLASHGVHMLLPHLAAVKQIEQALGNRAMLELHDGNREAAWTNLLAATRLAAAYNPEPAEVSQLVRFSCATLAMQVTWQALQAGGWPDDRLAALQQEWASVDFFRSLPETAAFTRAGMAAACRDERRQPVPGPGNLLQPALRSPRSAWQNLLSYWNRIQYRHHGTYEDEKALLLHYRDRELELRRAVQSPAWAQMRQLPGVTNAPPFRSKHSSMLLSLMNIRQMTLAVQMQGAGLLGRAAEAEVRRRLILTAIALERFRGRHGSYPKALDELVPELLKRPATDFMDGQPLRYRLTDDGHFVLYSVGLDCADNGGEMQRQTPRDPSDEDEDRMSHGIGAKQGRDLVWPRPASGVEVRTKQEAEVQARQDRMAEQAREEQRLRELTMTMLEQRCAEEQDHRIVDVVFEGKPLSQVLRNTKPTGTNQLDLHDLLTLRPVITGEEPRIITCELAISYDTVHRIGSLQLLVDRGPEPTNDVIYSSSPEGRAYFGGGELQACERATNGNCLLIWNTFYDTPGKHFLQSQLLCTERQNDWRTVEACGPILPFFSTNICQFFPGSAMFDDTGAILCAKLAESNATYSIELKSPGGALLKTLAGGTTNGVIDLDWDLNDEHGNACTNESLDAVFHVTLTESKRSQAQALRLNRLK